MAKKSSNKAIYWVIGIIVILAAAGFGGYKVWHHYQRTQMMVGGQPTVTNNTAPNATPTLSSNGSSGLSNKSDTSNEQLDQDTQNIQNSLNKLDQDQTSVNQSFANQSADTPK